MSATSTGAWRMAFLALNHEQQKRRICTLAAAGLPERAICAMTNWDLADVRRAISDHTATQQPLEDTQP
jgi:hypothetical protein